jgi:tRNA-dihydrouridine synthase
VISEGVEAARLAKESGARWIDLNVGWVCHKHMQEAKVD